jgi:hypothetical protein
VTSLGRAAAFILLLAAAAAPLSAATRYDPRLRFRTITTPRFLIHYHQGEEAEARRLARIAEAVAARIDAELGPPDERVHVILVDQTDLSNGWATPVPHNVIEIAAAAPPGESMIGNTDDWLRLVFTHEYTHIVHLSRKGGWIGGLRRVFGRQPLLYPNIFQPLWQIEGIATYAESAHTGQGRVPAGDFRMILERAAASDRFERLDRANGGLVDWPSGHTPYLYGAYFHQFLADRYGAESLRRLTDDTARRLPYTGFRAYKKVFGKSLGTLWTEFEADARRTATEPSMSATRLTHHGFTVGGPRYALDNRVFYSVVNPHGFPALMELAPDRREPRRVAERYLGNRIAFAGVILVFDQIEYVRNVGLQSDLYALLVDRPDVWRLTRGARAGDPDVSPDGRTIVCTIQESDRRSLATMALPAERGVPGVPVPLISEVATDFNSPRWSPDGRWIAAERRRLGGTSEIVLVDAQNATVRALPIPDARNVSPAWMPDGARLLFASAPDREPFRIHAIDISTGALTTLADTGPSAHSPDVSRNGDIVFVGYTRDGYDLFSLRADSARWLEVAGIDAVRLKPDATAPDTANRDATQPVAAKAPPAPAHPDRPYSPLRTLAPRFWSPVIESDGADLVLGAATAGVDVLGRHGYAVSAGWSTTRGRPDWWMGYAYDRWWPTLFAAASDDTDSWLDGEIRTREVNAGALVPFRRVRWTQTAVAAFNASTDLFDCTECGPGVAGRVARRSLRAGWTFDSARSYGYSISDVDGTAMSFSLESTLRGLGADGSGGAAVLDARHYLAAAPRHAVVALRVAGAGTWGDADVRRIFSAAGFGPQLSGVTFGTDAIGLLRGFGEASTAGFHALVANIDYRLPILRVQRGAGTLPVFLRTIHAAAFLDAGDAWTRRFDLTELKLAAGVELSFDTIIGYALPVTFSAGGAWRRDPTGADRGFAAFGRIGRAF